MIRKLFSKAWFPWMLWFLVGCINWFCIRLYRFFALFFWGYAAWRLVWYWLGLLKHKRPKLAKACKIVLVTGLVLVLAAATVTECFVVSGAGGSKEAESDYLLVLGAGVNGTVPSRSLYLRLVAAEEYLNTYPDAICIVSGGQGPGEDITEAQCMYDFLVARGIDPERIWQEDRATSTEENLHYTLALVREKTGSTPESMAVISSEYHLYRAGLMAEDQGLEMLGVPAKTTPAILRWHYYFREILALWAWWLL